MSSNQAILREYLVALGFRVNTNEKKTAERATVDLDKRITALGKAAVSTTTAIAGMVMVYARQLEKLYYASRYADTTAEHLQELESGAQRVGLQAGVMTGAMKNFAASIRSNPGLVGLLNSLGIQVQGRDKADVMMDFVKALKAMPFHVAERYAQMFGMDAETLFNLEKGSDEMEKQKELRRQMAAEMGVDTDDAAKKSVELMNNWRNLLDRVGLFGQALVIATAGPLTDMMRVTQQVLTDWAQIVKTIHQYGADDFWKKMREGSGLEKPGEGVKLLPEQAARVQMDNLPYHAPAGNKGLGKWLEMGLRRFYTRKGKDLSATGDAAAIDAATDPSGADLHPDMSEAERVRLTNERLKGAPSVSSGSQDPKTLFAALEAKYNLPPGLLDRVWARESSRGQNMVSPAGAKGHFGFMDSTAKEYGLQDPNDLGQSADASARKWRDLLKQYGGDLELAAAAYNWGDGNMAKYGLGKMPEETKGYVADVAGGLTVNQDININVTGNGSPEETAKAVAREQKGVGADTVRNFKARVR